MVGEMSQKDVEEENDRNWEGWRETDIKHFVLGLFGELGEFANKVKKYERFKLGWKGNCLNNEEFVKSIRGELADIAIYLYLITGKYGLNIEELVREKQKINRERFSWK